MKVIIREREYDYASDHPQGWLFGRGDYFKFPVKIGGNTCFIKRFEIAIPENISSNDMWGDKEYWVFVFNFYKEILHKQQLVPSDIHGVTLNYHQIIFLILRLKIYQSDRTREYHELFNNLPAYLNNISSSFKR